MLNGIFDVSLQSPLGPKKGILVLLQNGNVIRGTFSLFGKDNMIDRGIADADSCTFHGEIVTAVGGREYKATVAVNGDELFGELVFYLRTVPVKIPLLIPMKLTGKRRASDKINKATKQPKGI
jgi:hypothetical protein